MPDILQYVNAFDAMFVGNDKGWLFATNKQPSFWRLGYFKNISK